MKWYHYLLITVIVGTVLGIPIFPDPWHQQENVSFSVWLYREIDELLHGER